MKTFISVISLAATLTSMANGFSVTECSPQPAYHNYGSGGNGHCQSLPWTGVTSISYSSDKNCDLLAYSNPDCTGDILAINQQDICKQPKFTIQSVYCT